MSPPPVSRIRSWEAEIDRALSLNVFRLPVGGPVKPWGNTCWRDRITEIKHYGFRMLVSCDRPAGDNAVEMCAEHYTEWTKEVPE